MYHDTRNDSFSLPRFHWMSSFTLPNYPSPSPTLTAVMIITDNHPILFPLILLHYLIHNFICITMPPRRKKPPPPPRRIVTRHTAALSVSVFADSVSPIVDSSNSFSPANQEALDLQSPPCSRCDSKRNSQASWCGTYNGKGNK